MKKGEENHSSPFLLGPSVESGKRCTPNISKWHFGHPSQCEEQDYSNGWEFYDFYFEKLFLRDEMNVEHLDNLIVFVSKPNSSFGVGIDRLFGNRF